MQPILLITLFHVGYMLGNQQQVFQEYSKRSRLAVLIDGIHLQLKALKVRIFLHSYYVYSAHESYQLYRVIHLKTPCTFLITYLLQLWR